MLGLVLLTLLGAAQEENLRADIHAHPSRFHRAAVARIENEEIARSGHGRQFLPRMGGSDANRQTQSSTASAGTRLNSLVLCVATVKPRDLATDAMSRSRSPIG